MFKVKDNGNHYHSTREYWRDDSSINTWEAAEIKTQGNDYLDDALNEAPCYWDHHSPGFYFSTFVPVHWTTWIEIPKVKSNPHQNQSWEKELHWQNTILHTDVRVEVVWKSKTETRDERDQIWFWVIWLEFWVLLWLDCTHFWIVWNELKFLNLCHV